MRLHWQFLWQLFSSRFACFKVTGAPVFRLLCTYVPKKMVVCNLSYDESLHNNPIISFQQEVRKFWSKNEPFWSLCCREIIARSRASFFYQTGCVIIVTHYHRDKGGDSRLNGVSLSMFASHSSYLDTPYIFVALLFLFVVLTTCHIINPAVEKGFSFHPDSQGFS